MADINTSLLQWLNGPGPQYKVNGQLKMEAQEGQDGASYNIIYGADGKTPISSTNRFPVDLTGQTVSTSAQLTGSIDQSAPLNLQGLVNATAGTMDYHGQENCLNPISRNRIIAIKNTGDQSADVKIYPYISGIGSASSNIQLDLGVIGGNGKVAYITDGQLNEIKAPFDSVSVGVNYTTLPTSGGINITVQEVIDLT